MERTNLERTYTKRQVFWVHPQNCEKATISFVASVCLSAWNNLAPTQGIFMKFRIWVLFENPWTKFKFL